MSHEISMSQTAGSTCIVQRRRRSRRTCATLAKDRGRRRAGVRAARDWLRHRQQPQRRDARPRPPRPQSTLTRPVLRRPGARRTSQPAAQPPRLSPDRRWRSSPNCSRSSRPPRWPSKSWPRPATQPRSRSCRCRTALTGSRTLPSPLSPFRPRSVPPCWRRRSTLAESWTASPPQPTPFRPTPPQPTPFRPTPPQADTVPPDTAPSRHRSARHRPSRHRSAPTPPQPTPFRRHRPSRHRSARHRPSRHRSARHRPSRHRSARHRPSRHRSAPTKSPT